MSATNAHRLGANEAPPAIVSSFLGKQVSELLDHIEKADVDDILAMAGKQGLKMDIPEIPELFIDNTDRNRTSPFAFTGNRFEFRAVGSEANCASAMIALNSAVAEALVSFKKRVDAKIPEYEKKLAGTGLILSFGYQGIYAVLEVHQGFCHGCIQGNHRTGAVCLAAYGTELKAVTGEGKG